MLNDEIIHRKMSTKWPGKSNLAIIQHYCTFKKKLNFFHGPRLFTVLVALIVGTCPACALGLNLTGTCWVTSWLAVLFMELGL